MLDKFASLTVPGSGVLVLAVGRHERTFLHMQVHTKDGERVEASLVLSEPEVAGLRDELTRWIEQVARRED